MERITHTISPFHSIPQRYSDSSPRFWYVLQHAFQVSWHVSFPTDLIPERTEVHTFLKFAAVFVSFWQNPHTDSHFAIRSTPVVFQGGCICPLLQVVVPSDEVSLLLGRSCVGRREDVMLSEYHMDVMGYSRSCAHVSKNCDPMTMLGSSSQIYAYRATMERTMLRTRVNWSSEPANH